MSLESLYKQFIQNKELRGDLTDNADTAIRFANYCLDVMEGRSIWLVIEKKYNGLRVYKAFPKAVTALEMLGHQEFADFTPNQVNQIIDGEQLSKDKCTYELVKVKT